MAIAGFGLDMAGFWDEAVADFPAIEPEFGIAFSRILDQLATGTTGTTTTTAGSSITGTGQLGQADLERIAAWARRTQTSLYDEAVGEWIDAYLRGAGEVTRQAAQLGLPREAYEANLRRLADRRGLDGLRGDIIRTWWRTAVVEGGYTIGSQAMAATDPTKRLYPYQEHVAVQDDALRPPHNIIWVVRNGSSLAEQRLPPLDWNCRCRRRFINWREARSRFNDAQLGSDQPLGPARTVTGVPPADRFFE